MAKRVRRVAKKKKRVRQPRPQSRRRSDDLRAPESTNEGSTPEPPATRDRRYRIEEQLLRACLAEGMTQDDTCTKLGWMPNKYKSVERRLLANDGQRVITKSTAHRYYEYILSMEQIIRDLDYFIKLTVDDIESWQNYVGKAYEGSSPVAQKKIAPRPSIQPAIVALKAKADIHEKTIKMGQELGLIERRAKELRLSGQINLAAMPNEQLRLLLDRRLIHLKQLVQEGKIPPTFQKMLKGAVSDGRERDREPEYVVDADVVEKVS